MQLNVRFGLILTMSLKRKTKCQLFEYILCVSFIYCGAYALDCAQGCSKHGTCFLDPAVNLARCDCPPGRVGDICDRNQFPSCELWPGYTVGCGPAESTSCTCLGDCRTAGFSFAGSNSRACYRDRELGVVGEDGPVWTRCNSTKPKTLTKHNELVEGVQMRLMDVGRQGEFGGSARNVARVQGVGFPVGRRRSRALLGRVKRGKDGQTGGVKLRSYQRPGGGVDFMHAAALAKRSKQRMEQRVSSPGVASPGGVSSSSFRLSGGSGAQNKRPGGGGGNMEWKVSRNHMPKGSEDLRRASQPPRKKVDEKCPARPPLPGEVEEYRQVVEQALMRANSRKTSTRDVRVPINACPQSCSLRGSCHQQTCYEDTVKGRKGCVRDGSRPPPPWWNETPEGTKILSAICDCFFGYEGEGCEIESNVYCLGGCTGRGSCVRGVCKCQEGYFGADCGLTLKPSEEKDGQPQVVRWETGQSHDPEKSPKVYVYELPPHFTGHYYAHLAYKRNPEKQTSDWIHPALEGPLGGDFFVGPPQLFLHELFLRSDHRTTDASKADFFFVPTWARAAEGPVNTGGRFFLQIVGYIREKWPYWDRSEGKDHIFVFPHDQGACLKLNGHKALEQIKNSIFLSHFGLSTNTAQTHKHPYGCSGPCHIPGKDIVIPPPLSIPVETSPLFHAGFGPENRTILCFLAGSMGITHYNTGSSDGVPLYSHGVRQQIYNLHRNDPGFKIVKGSTKSYLTFLSTSVFCIAPSGLGFGVRLYHAILFGCIPVIIQDEVSQAYEDILPYPLFSLRVAESDIPKLPEILRNVSQSQIKSMRTELRCVWPHFLWSSLYGATHPNPEMEDGSRDAFATLLALLEMKIERHSTSNMPNQAVSSCDVQHEKGSTRKVLGISHGHPQLCATHCLIGGRRACVKVTDYTREKLLTPEQRPVCGRTASHPRWQPWPQGGALYFTKYGANSFEIVDNDAWKKSLKDEAK